MPNPLLCRVVLANGQRCGYEPQGKDSREKIADLFRHEREHLPVKESQ